MLQRKLERAMVYGVDSLATGSGPDGSGEQQEQEDEDTEPHASISGMFFTSLNAVSGLKHIFDE